MTRCFRYPLRGLIMDYAVSVAGFAAALGLLLLVRPAVPVAWALAAAAALFLVYFGRTVCRQLTQIDLDKAGIRARGPAAGLLGASIRWEDLCSLRLGYYSTRRDGEGGWMELKLADARHTIRIDSAVDGFAELAGAAARAAARRELALDSATAANLKVLLP